MARLAACGWQGEHVDDRNDVAALDAALQRARADESRPSLICVRTHIGYGSPHKQDTYEAHGAPLGEEEVRLTRQRLSWPTVEPFFLPDEVLACFRQALARGAAQEAVWQQRLGPYRWEDLGPAGEYERDRRGNLANR